jgi:DNA-directed RNA polymerase specialized sigma24 family protein
MTRTQDDYLSEVLRLEQPLPGILHRFAPHSAELGDLLQETYSRLFSLAPERRMEIRNVQAFAITPARYIALDWIRRQQAVSVETAANGITAPSGVIPAKAGIQ